MNVKKILLVVCLAAALIVTAVLLMQYRNETGDEARHVSEKVQMLIQVYGLKEDDFITQDGGYDESTGRWHYEFTYNNGGNMFRAVYDGEEDLSEDTLDELTSEKIGERCY